MRTLKTRRSGTTGIEVTECGFGAWGMGGGNLWRMREEAPASALRSTGLLERPQPRAWGKNRYAWE